MALKRTRNLKPLTKNFKIWPKTDDPAKYGPNPKQRLLFLDRLSYEEKIGLQALGHRAFQPDGRPYGSNLAHLHPTSIDLLIGGAGSSKSVAAEARCIDTLRRYPRCRVLVGSTNLPFLKKTVLQDWRDIWTPEGEEDWGHPDVRQRFVKNDLTMVLNNEATAIFLSLEGRAKFIRSQRATVIHIEEGSTLGDGDDIIDEFIPRLRDPNCPWHQLIITTNPEEKFGPLTKRFSLRQWEDGYNGEPMPVGGLCQCQWCDQCKQKKEEIPWIKNICPACGHKKPKDMADCPGNQYYHRVIFMYPDDNPHLPSTLASDTAGAMNAEKHAILVGGAIKERRSGVIYDEFRQDMVLKADKPLNPKMDIYWALDFNKMPQCSVICQIYGSNRGNQQIHAAQEIILPNKSAASVVKDFVRRLQTDLPNWNRTVWIYGDASGFAGATDDMAHNYDIITAYLDEKKIKYELVVRAKNPLITKRAESVQEMLKQRRIIFNPGTEWLIQSFKETKWEANGLKEDENMDKFFRRRVKDTSSIYGLTHPAVALGYLIAEEFPIIETEETAPFLMTSDGRILEFSKGNMQELLDPTAPEGELPEDFNLDEDIESESTQYMRGSDGAYMREMGWLDL